MDHPLSPEAIAAALTGLPGWRFAGDALHRDLALGDFRRAMAFLVRAAFEAEALDHHPEWTNVYDRVSITLRTHHAGNVVTARDVELARRISALVDDPVRSSSPR